jgi:hypothetical protein
MKTIGYKSGFRYLTDGKEVYRNDYADAPDRGVRWFSTLAGFQSFLKGYGPLHDTKGEAKAVDDESQTFLCINCGKKMHPGEAYRSFDLHGGIVATCSPECHQIITQQILRGEI